MTSREALDTLRGMMPGSEAVETVAAELAQLRSLVNRVIDAGVTRWHSPEEEMPIYDWLELTREEYDDWVLRSGIFSGDASPYRLDDDEAIERGYQAMRRMKQMRVGSLKDHAQAFRNGLSHET